MLQVFFTVSEEDREFGPEVYNDGGPIAGSPPVITCLREQAQLLMGAALFPPVLPLHPWSPLPTLFYSHHFFYPVMYSIPNL